MLQLQDWVVAESLVDSNGWISDPEPVKVAAHTESWLILQGFNSSDCHTTAWFIFLPNLKFISWLRWLKTMQFISNDWNKVLLKIIKADVNRKPNLWLKLKAASVLLLLQLDNFTKVLA